MWKDLSMQQRADLMDIYLSHGISSLEEMRNHYDSRNQFASGGNLFSGEDEPTQQMNNGLNLYRRTNILGETEYIYQETPDSEEILLTPTNKRFSDDPTNWDYKDASGREYSPKMVKPAVAQAELRPYEKDWYHKMTEALGYDWLVNKSNEYYNNPILGAAARWAASYDNNTNPIKGLWNSPLAYGNVYSMAAKAADNLFLNPNGLQKTIDLYNNSDGSYSDRYAWQKSLLGDVVEASMISPAVREAYKSSEPLITASKTYLQNNYPAVFDPYTSWDATLGYHGDNIFSRALGTIGRRSDFTFKPEMPELHRRLRIESPEEFKFTNDGKMIISGARTVEGHNGITNFGTSEAARSHSRHRELSGIDDYIINPRAIRDIEGVEWKSIQPSDTFIETAERVAIDPKDITLVSGNTEVLNAAREKGMKTLSSPRLRELQELNHPTVVQLDPFGRFEGIRSGGYNNQIGDEIQRLTSMRGAPTMEDYAYFEDMTGLNSGVMPASLWDGTNEGGRSLLGEWGSVKKTPTFNNVVYSPASSIESIYRKAKIGEIPWYDYYEALNKMPSARAQLQVADTPQITAENAASITPEQWTAALDTAIAKALKISPEEAAVLTKEQLDAAIANGADMTEFQRLRALHFKTHQTGDMIDADGNPIHVYHGSPAENITEFYKPNDSRLPTANGKKLKATGEEGIYTSPSKGYATNYITDFDGRYRIPLTREQKLQLRAGKTREEIGIPPSPKGRVYDLYSNTKIVPEEYELDFNPFTLSTEEANSIKKAGYTGFNILGKKYPEHVVLEPSQLKSADAVTFGDNGVRIPLGERDNFNINDIRYGLLPFGIGLTGYGLWQRNE